MGVIPKFNESIWPKINLFNEEKDYLNKLSNELNIEIKEEPFNFLSEEINNNSETFSLFANHEDYTERKEFTLDSDYITMDNTSIEKIVKQQIKETSIDALVEEWWMSKEVKDPSKNFWKMRFKKTKTPLQISKLEEALLKYPKKFSKKERAKFAKEIGLDEVQVYKWYYDNTQNKRVKKAIKSNLESLDTQSL